MKIHFDAPEFYEPAVKAVAVERGCDVDQLNVCPLYGGFRTCKDDPCVAVRAKYEEIFNAKNGDVARDNANVPAKFTPKPTNPKQAFNDTKIPLSVVPAELEYWEALAFLEGALKYGRANWLISGVRVSTYIDAHKRHLKKFCEGEWADPKTRVPHLVSAIGCLKIILSAMTASMFPAAEEPKKIGGALLTDDRAPAINIAALEAHTTEIANHLRELFKEHQPRHYTIDDTRVVSNS